MKPILVGQANYSTNIGMAPGSVGGEGPNGTSMVREAPLAEAPGVVAPVIVPDTPSTLYPLQDMGIKRSATKLTIAYIYGQANNEGR